MEEKFDTIEEIEKGKVGKVRIRGWVHHKRSSGSIVFYIVRDGTGFIQVTFKKEDFGEKIKEIDKLPVESVVVIEGIAKEDKRSPFGYEIEAKKIEILSKAFEGYPIAKKYHGVDFLLRYRHLSIRDRKKFLIFLIRSKFLQFAREWFWKEGFKEFTTPSFVSSACEGGSTLFEVKYFDRKAYLTQSWQLYAEAGIAILGKIFTIQPSFRAEKSRTRRHLTEYTHLEAEIPFCDMECLIEIEEKFISEVTTRIAEELSKELKELGVDPEKLKEQVKRPFPRITYTQAVEILKKKGIKFEWGEDFGADEEKILIEEFKRPFFVTHYPKKAKAFYHKPDPKNPEVTLSVDMLAPNVGEIIGSGERISDYEELVRRIKEEGLDPKDYEWYVELRKWGSVPHSGFGLGVERYLMWILNLDHVREAIPFPRTITRVYP